MNERERKRALRKARRLLENPTDPAAIMRGLFALRGFDVLEAVDKQIEHIRAGNLRALESYLAGALPQPAKRLKIQQQTAIAHMNVTSDSDRLSPPPMAARAIGPAKVEEASE